MKAKTNIFSNIRLILLKTSKILMRLYVLIIFEVFQPQNVLVFFFFLYSMKLSYLLTHVEYFHTTREEYKLYPNGTSDYTKKDVIDGVQVILS